MIFKRREKYIKLKITINKDIYDNDNIDELEIRRIFNLNKFNYI